MMRVIAGLAFLLLVAPSATSAQVVVSVDGVFSTASVDWAQSRSFTAFLEPARYDAAYAADPTVGFDVGIQVGLLKGVGPALAFSRVSREVAGTLDATIPHPLYFDRDRDTSAELSGFDHSEQAVHLGLGWQGQSGSLGFALFGGVSLFEVTADAFDTVDFDQTFPFEEVTLRSPRPVERTSEPTGFHVGGRLDWRISRNLGLGAQLRLSGATAEFSLPDGETMEIDAGGLDVGVGLRIYF